jgi:hypothetical protein
MNETRNDRGEKEEEKRSEKDEKSVEEKWREDPLSAAAWAGILIWAGVALLLGNLGALDNTPFQGWDLAFLGAGAILLLEAVIRYAIPSYRGPVIGTVIVGMIFLAIGLGDLGVWDIIWPIAIVLIGLSLLLRGVTRRG